MLIVVDPHSGVPVYRQLMDQIRFHVASGLLAPGDELPSTRVLSAELGVNPMTISKAYSFLEREGLVERRPGRPLVVSGVSSDGARTRRLEQLVESLAPTVTVARQLGLADDEVVETLRRMLDGAEVLDGSQDRADSTDKESRE